MAIVAPKVWAYARRFENLVRAPCGLTGGASVRTGALSDEKVIFEKPHYQFRPDARHLIAVRDQFFDGHFWVPF
jgi:hypothetical protein